MWREKPREKEEKGNYFSNYSRSFAPQMLGIYARAVKLIVFFFVVVVQ